MKSISVLLMLLVSGYLVGKPDRVVKYDGARVSPAALRQRSKEALTFCRLQNFNTDLCILVDLSLHSGVHRFFVWDFKRDTVVLSALVSHGCGSNPWSWTMSSKKAIVSNVNGSHCSSAGKYRVGKRGYSNWGIGVNYQLHGLEKTNSNALARQIVFHSWDKIADREVYPQGTPEGWGCPAISNAAMRQIDPKLKAVKKPVLLWIYQ